MHLPVRLCRASLCGLLLALLAVVAMPSTPASAAGKRCAGASDVPSRSSLVKTRHATMCLINRERTKRGLRKLRTNRTLDRSARRYAREMVRRSFFDHVTPSGETFTERIRRQTRYLAGTLRWEIGENLAWGTGARATPAQILRSWMRSRGHRRNILDRSFREMGLGIALGTPVAASAASGAATYANQFGRRG